MEFQWTFKMTFKHLLLISVIISLYQLEATNDTQQSTLPNKSSNTLPLNIAISVLIFMFVAILISFIFCRFLKFFWSFCCCFNFYKFFYQFDAFDSCCVESEIVWNMLTLKTTRDKHVRALTNAKKKQF